MRSAFGPGLSGEATVFYRVLMSAMIIAGAAAAIYLFSMYRLAPVNNDGAFYISISRDVLRGAVPTVDVSSTYTPGIYYTIAAVMKLFGSGYSTILLFVYVIQAANTVLLYLLLSRYIQSRLVRIFTCLSYYYSNMLLEGSYFCLEPFQIFFILLGVLLYLSTMRLLYKLPLAGLCLGCSIMYKQYSVLALVAVCASVWFECRRSSPVRQAIFRVLTTLFFSAVPYLLFILLTKATVAGSLFSFGFLGDRAITYVSGGISGWVQPLENFGFSLIRANWLFIPVLIAVYLRRYYMANFQLDPIIPALFAVFILPLFVRRYIHYYQLMAPWAYVIGAVAVDWVICGRGVGNRFKSSIAAPVPKAVVLIMYVLVFFETLFLTFELPFDKYEKMKSRQFLEAAEINEVFPRGSRVYVIDHPQIYFTGDFISPVGDYGFPLNEKKAGTIDWSKVEKLIVRNGSGIPGGKSFEDLGFRRVSTRVCDTLTIYYRESRQ